MDELNNKLEDIDLQASNLSQEVTFTPLQKESQAKQRGSFLNDSIASKILSAFDLLNTILINNEKTLLISEIIQPNIPEKLMYSHGELIQNTIHRLTNVALIAKFPDYTFIFCIELGYCKSPKEIVDNWTEKYDLWYPMIRIINGEGKIIATIYFDPQTTMISINSNDVMGSETENIINQAKTNNGEFGENTVIEAVTNLLKVGK